MLKFQKELSYITLSLILTACNGGSKSSSNSSTTFASTQSPIETTNIDSDQIKIATRICYAYESKSNNFRSVDYQKFKYNFSVQNLTCSSSEQYNVEAAILENSDSDTIYFSTSSKKQFYSTIQTHDTGYLTKVCKKIKNNQSISNTTVTGNVKTQIYFFNDGSDSYILKYFTLSGNTYQATAAETFKVRTQYNYSSGTILGMDEVYNSVGTCASSTKNYSFVQSYTGKN